MAALGPTASGTISAFLRTGSPPWPPQPSRWVPFDFTSRTCAASPPPTTSPRASSAAVASWARSPVSETGTASTYSTLPAAASPAGAGCGAFPRTGNSSKDKLSPFA
ncbi:hypothetical protein VTG60DRAFT_3584 [Thermothelomyces hinnuleus]